MSLLFPDKPSPAIRGEQVRLLYQQGSPVQLLGLLTAVIAVALFWGVADRGMLLLWLAVMVIVYVARLAANVRFSKIAESDYDAERWANIYIAGTFLSGLAWGALAFFYTPAWPVPHQVMLFVIYSGLIGGAFNTNSSVFTAFPAFYLSPVACLMYVMLQQSGEGYVELTLLFAIYIAQMHTSSVRFYNRLTQTLGLQFENEKLAESLTHSNERLLRLAEIDPLTQVFNRRSMDRFLSDEWVRHLKDNRALTVLFLDIDYFKEYNDTYGHLAGDHCLCAVAQTLRENIRNERDMVARYGGEEFAVILPHTECREARHIAQRIMEDIQELCIMHTNSRVADELTVSIGITTMVPDPKEDVSAILSTADKALYDAKRGGRNRVVCAAA